MNTPFLYDARPPDALTQGCVVQSKKNDIVKVIANKVLDLVILEINKEEMKDVIKNKVIHPLLNMVYLQLFPYLVAFGISFILILFILILVLVICLILYLKK